ncbi:hypothetical protein JW964_27375 [candidate division KSB1 bacterium]|nr:hypothetical protein [candidate division KSB1 bacterium]
MFKIGDSVKVKPNIKDPDFDIIIENWQGRITEIDEKEDLITIEWDSITVENMPDSVIEKSEEDGYEWEKMTLNSSDLEITQPRDKQKDVNKKIKQLKKRYAYSWLGETGKRISIILKNTDPDDEGQVLDAWCEHLEKTLKFPFDARVAECFLENCPIRYNDRLNVENIFGVDDLYGVIVKVRKSKNIYHYPLCDLEVIDKKTSNYELVDDYAVWFANR